MRLTAALRKINLPLRLHYFVIGLVLPAAAAVLFTPQTDWGLTIILGALLALAWAHVIAIRHAYGKSLWRMIAETSVPNAYRFFRDGTIVLSMCVLLEWFYTKTIPELAVHLWTHITCVVCMGGLCLLLRPFRTATV